MKRSTYPKNQTKALIAYMVEQRTHGKMPWNKLYSMVRKLFPWYKGKSANTLAAFYADKKARGQVAQAMKELSNKKELLPAIVQYVAQPDNSTTRRKELAEKIAAVLAAEEKHDKKQLKEIWYKVNSLAKQLNEISSRLGKLIENLEK